MQIIENAIPQQFFDVLRNQIFDGGFAWYFGETSNNISAESIYGYSFSHIAYRDGVSNSTISYDCRSALFLCLSKLNINIKKLLRIRIGLLYPTPINNYVNVPHVDDSEPHNVGILYLNNSDADTIIYKEQYNAMDGVSYEDYYNNVLKRNLTVYKQIKCKENTFVTFNGSHYHSSVCPSNVSRRIVINFNYI